MAENFQHYYTVVSFVYPQVVKHGKIQIPSFIPVTDIFWIKNSPTNIQVLDHWEPSRSPPWWQPLLFFGRSWKGPRGLPVSLGRIILWQLDPAKIVIIYLFHPFGDYYGYIYLYLRHMIMYYVLCIHGFVSRCGDQFAAMTSLSEGRNCSSETSFVYDHQSTNHPG